MYDPWCTLVAVSFLKGHNLQCVYKRNGSQAALQARGREDKTSTAALCFPFLLLHCRVWVPVRLDAADNLQQVLSACLHADGSCGPPGSKQRVLLDLQCRGFAVQVRYDPHPQQSAGEMFQSQLACFAGLQTSAASTAGK